MFADAPPPPSASTLSCCAVLELRQYTLHPGARDTLIDLFEQHFLEGQEAHEMRIVGQFRDLVNAQRFVWVRGFTSMEARARATDAFYDGPVWRAHRAAANATMVDSDNVLLLKPVEAGADLPCDARERPPLDAPEGGEASRGVVVATIHSFDREVDPAFAPWFAREVMPRLARAGTTVLGRFVTETAPNVVTRLPVRANDRVFVWFATYPDRSAYEAARRAVEETFEWQTMIAPKLRAMTRGEPERLLLAPTRRSVLRHRATGSARRGAHDNARPED